MFDMGVVKVKETASLALEVDENAKQIQTLSRETVWCAYQNER